MARAYFIADLSTLAMDAELLRYRDQVPATIAAHGGRYLVRGGALEQFEGEAGDPASRRIVMLEFPSMEAARAWYRSPEYQAILPLRLRHMRGTAMLVAGAD